MENITYLSEKTPIAMVLLFSFICLLLFSDSSAVEVTAERSAEIKKYISIIKKGTPEEKIKAMKALGKMKAKAAPAIKTLIMQLDIRASDINLDFAPHQIAARTLVKIGKPSVEPLIKSLKHKNEFVRKYSAYCLGKIGDKKAIKSLRVAEKDKSPEVKTWAETALCSIMYKDTDLHKAAHKNYNSEVPSNEAEIIPLLVKHGANLNAKDTSSGSTPLHIAVSNGNIKAVTAILKCGAKVNIKNQFGQTPLDIAEVMEKKKIIKTLKKQGAR